MKLTVMRFEAAEPSPYKKRQWLACLEEIKSYQDEQLMAAQMNINMLNREIASRAIDKIKQGSD